MAKSWNDGKEMEEVHRQYYEDLDYDEDVDEGKEDTQQEKEQEEVWIEEDVWIEQEEDTQQELEQEEEQEEVWIEEDVWIEQEEVTQQEEQQEDVRIVVREKERRRQEKEDERYHQVMREADEDHCVPMVITRKQELENDQKKYQEVLQAADEDMGIPIVVRSNPTEEEQYHQLVKEADEDPCIPPAAPEVLVPCPPRCKLCFICQLPMRHPFRHTAKLHLPWYVAAESACFHCKQQFAQVTMLKHHINDTHPEVDSEAKFGPDKYQMWVQLVNGLLRELARMLEVSYPDGLVNFINCLNIAGNVSYGASQELTFRTEEVFLADIFCQINNLPKFSFNIFNNFGQTFINSLLHWKILKIVISKLTPEQQNFLQNFEEQKDRFGLPIGCLSVKPTGPLMAVDAHFHLDQLMVKTGLTGIHELDDMGTADLYKTKLSFLVANYCNPAKFPSSTERSEIRKDHRIRLSFGIHPRIVNSNSTSTLDRFFKNLISILDSSKTVSVGECGLDTTDRPNYQNFQKQVTYFEKQLNLAVQKNLPVVIHSRGDRNLNLATLTSMVNTLPQNHKIHWHCFTGTEEIFESASSHFSDIVFGVTPFIFTNKYPTIKQFICNKGIDRIVLESDAPYIRYKEEIANPYTVIFVAHEISKLLLIPVEEVLATTTKNSQMIYGC
ncbi:tatD [Mytilus edulis]|uniref:TatD n=1 Tax=Mytilus edulis TaxID=6550 RepID=A0A8S3SN47_MYTED|nr:tatD [Mytilus edulis]